MLDLKQLIKDYGAAIGPALAFLFGMIALFAKHKIDQWTATWSLNRRFANLKHLVSKTAPPSSFFPSTSDQFPHADQLRNRTNLARFYSKLLGLRPVFDALEKSIAESGTPDMVSTFYNMKWWFDIVVKEVQGWRDADEFNMTSANLANLQHTWQNLNDAAKGGEFAYIERKDRDQGAA